MILGLFSIQLFTAINSSSQLFNFDPYRHLFYTDFGESVDFLNNEIPVHNGIIIDRYKTLLRANTFIFSQVTGFSNYQIFRFGSIILRGLYIILIYLVLREFTKNASISLLGTILLFSSPQVIWRSTIYWPDNLANLFFIFALWILEKYRNEKNEQLLYLLAISFLGEIFTHPPSLYILGFIIIGYLAYFLIEKDLEALKKIAIAGLISLIISFPIVADIVEVVINKTLVNNLGDSSRFAPLAKIDIRYTPPDLTFFLSQSGPVLILLAAFGLIYCLYHNFKRSLPLVIFFSLTFLLSLSTYFDLYVPPDRIQAYLIIPLLLLSISFLDFFFSSQSSPILKILISTILVLISFANLHMMEPWIGYKNGETESATVINALMEEDPDTLVWIERNADLVIFLLEKPENICLPEHLWYFQISDSPVTNQECLSADYRLSDLPQPIHGYQLVDHFQYYYLFERTNKQ